MTRIIDPFDELAAMFLSPGQENGNGAAHAPLAVVDPDATPQHATTVQRSGLVELLLVGHLPVRAGLWLTPYADALARQVGPVGLIRLEGADCSVQMLRGPDPVRAWANPQGMEHAIRELGGMAAAWVIRPRSESNAEEWIRAGIGRVTILSSADDAAVVAAYQVMKNVVDAARHLERPVPQIGLAIVGAEPRQATVVVDRINRTASTHLGVEAPLAMCLPRMDAGIRSTGYVSFPGQGNQPLADVIGWINAAEDAATMAAPAPLRFPMQEATSAPRAAASAATNPAPAPARAPIGAASHESNEPAKSAVPVVASSVVSANPPTSTDADPAPVAPAPMPPKADIKMPPRAAADVEAKTPCAASHPHQHGKTKGLAEFVRGLRPLPFRPPEHERVELAADDTGALHVLAWEAQMRDLEVVEAWAHKHRELIGLACPSMGLDFARPVQSHVFTDEPASLADLHGTGYRLHVLARVEIEGHIGWYAAPLNRPA